jgi:NAD(P)-dependent dehydrogenase (short-subunit alcohol dehydrogenase family)
MKADTVPRSRNTQHVLITGGASGLGLGCAMRFVKLGANVTIADINAAAGEKALAQLRMLGASQLHFEQVDLSDADSIRSMAQRLTVRGEPIDVLINNAGIYPPSRMTLSKEGQELTFAIAHLGHFRLTHALWPLLKAAPAARVVSVTSLVQRKAKMNPDDLNFSTGYLPIKAYQQAKLSNLLFALELQRKLDATGSPISSYAAHPGVVRTQLGRNRKIADNDTAWQRFSSKALGWGLGNIGQTPENGAASIVVAATSAAIPRGAFIGPKRVFETFGKPCVVTPGPAAQNAQLAAALWARTEELTGIRWAC